jgi:hypothetical protein
MLFIPWVFISVEVNSDTDVSDAACTEEVSTTLPTSTPSKQLKLEITPKMNP